MNTARFNFLDKYIAMMRLKKVVRTVDENDRVLDFGCGVRSNLLEILKNKISIGIGLDYDAVNLKRGNIEYVREMFKGKLSFSDASFDKIFLLAVLEHIEIDKVNFLFNEFFRVLKRDGKIILTTPTPRSKNILEFLAYKLNVISKEEIMDHKMYYDKSRIIELAKSTGLILSTYHLFQLGLNSYAILQKNNYISK